MPITSLNELIASHIRLTQSDDPPMQVVVHPDNIMPLLEESGDAHPFEGDGTGAYLAFGLPVFLDFNCPGAVVMNGEQTKLWREHHAANAPFGSLSLR